VRPAGRHVLSSENETVGRRWGHPRRSKLSR
jgi:hypothetical protein